MSESSPSSRSCPKCGETLPVEATNGLCPVCLMSMAMHWTQVTQPMAPPQKVLTIEELSPHFPQLEILELIGRGGMGVVYKARQKSLDRFVALKLLAPSVEKDTTFATRFATEARALAQLDHPNIVTVYDFGESGGFYYLLMEYIDGVNLRQAMQTSRFTPEQALTIVPTVCEALQYAHERGIVHRDIKPENLLMNKAGRIKIADFGIAKMVGVGEKSAPLSPYAPDPRTTLVGGTPQYMAPEQKHNAAADHRADIYSLGVVLYELLTGELPTASLQPLSQRVQVDVRLDEIVLKALQKTPELRYQTAAELRTQLATIIPSRESAPKEVVKNKKPLGLMMTVFRAVLLVIGGAVLLVAVGIAIPVMFRSRTVSKAPQKPKPLAEAASAAVQTPVLQTVDLKFSREGAYDQTRSYRPMSARTTEAKPSAITKLPNGLIKPWYGRIELGPQASKVPTTFLVDWIPGQNPVIAFDTNQNGDLTDDPSVQLSHSSRLKDGQYAFSGKAWVNLPFGAAAEKTGLNFHSMPMEKDSQAAPMIIYHLDCMALGEVQLTNGLMMKALLKDADNDGDFSNDPTLLVDINGDGRFTLREEYFRDSEAVQIDGVRYEMRDIRPDGTRFTWASSIRPLLASVKPVESSPRSRSGKPSFPLSKVSPGMALTTPAAAGYPAPGFSTTTMEGESVAVPASYKGKLLLLDFWATWCGPCIAEMPNVMAADRKYRDQGLAVLGISLDSDKSLAALPKFIKDRRLPWPQICEGESFSSSICRLYGISGIPATVLIDGDTGMILGNRLRGEELHQAIEKALAEKKK